MPTWPFTPAFPSGLPEGQPATGAEITKIDANAAAAASGLIWSDTTLLRSYQVQNDAEPYTPARKSTVYDAATRRWMTHGLDVSSNPLGVYSVSGIGWFHQEGAILNSPGITSIKQAASDGQGRVLLGVQPTGTSTGKLRMTTDGGKTWTALFLGSNDSQAVESVVYNAALNLWIVTVGQLGGDGIYTCDPSVNMGVWTARSTLSSNSALDLVSRNSPSPRILAMNATGPGAITAYHYSDDGINWTPQTSPFNQAGMKRPCWSDYHGVFAVCAPNGGGIWTSPTGLTGSWTLRNDFITSGLCSFGRHIIRGDGYSSLDGCVTWTQLVELDDVNYEPFAGEHGVVFTWAHASNNQIIYTSMQAG